MLAWALQPNAAAECLFHVALAVFSGVQAFQLVASSSRLRLRPRAGSSEPPAMSARVYHTALAGLYLSLGVIDLAVFGIVFDKKADFFSTYMKTVCVGVLAIGAGAAHLIVATEAAAAEAVAVDGGGARAGEAGAAAGGPSRPAAAVASRQQAVAKMEILGPLAMAVLALTVARDDYSWVSRYASELAVFEAGLLLATAVAGMHALATSTAAKTARPGGGGGLASRSRREGVPGSHWLFAGGIVAMAAVTWSLQMTFQLFVPATSLSSYGMEERVEAVPPMLGFHVLGAFLVRQLVQLLLDRAGGGGGGGSRCRSRRSCFGSCCSGDRRAVRGRRGHKEVYKSVAGAEREEGDGGGGEGGAGGPGDPSSDSDGGGDAEDPSSSSSSGGSSGGSGSD